MKQAVIDLGFGDSGKGISTSFLCLERTGKIVVRANGGHQAGHTIVHRGHKHIFSQFGSGTLQGNPTYISRFCTVYPNSLVREYEYLKGFNPILMIDPLTMVTTPFDIDHNRYLESKKQHGSVGMGFGQTIQRNEDFFKLYFQDLYFEDVLRAKLMNIGIVYYKLHEAFVKKEVEDFMAVCKSLVQSKFCRMRIFDFIKDDNLVFEGAQGILLDQDYGFFPNVTRSYCTSRNILELAPDLNEIYYVTRTYQTRHGNGFMTNEDKIPTLTNNEGETNKSHPYQGQFRVTELDPELLKYSLQCDSNYSKGIPKNLIITCYDQCKIDIDKLIIQLEDVVKFERVYVSSGPDSRDISIYRTADQPA